MRVHTSLRRLAGLAVAGLAVIAPAPALAHGGGAVFTETNASANAVQAYAQAADGTLTPGARVSHRRFRNGCRRPGLRGRARPRSRLAACRERRLERRLGVPRARHASRAREPRALGRHDAEQRHARPRHRLRAQQRRHRQHQRLQAHPPRPRPAERRHAAALVGHRRAPCRSRSRPRGDQLVVSEKGANTIDTYPVDRWGRAGPGTAHASAGAAPFGFAFGRHDSLLVTEAGASALSSYQLDPFATITASLLNGQGAACWAASTRSGRLVYTANAATDSISAYSVAWDGSLALVTPGGATAQLAAGTHPLDEAISRDRTLYVNGGNTGTHQRLPDQRERLADAARQRQRPAGRLRRARRSRRPKRRGGQVARAACATWPRAGATPRRCPSRPVPRRARGSPASRCRRSSVSAPPSPLDTAIACARR